MNPCPALLLAFAAAAVATAAPTFKSDIEYAQAAGESLKLDACVPEGAGPFPAVILIHGGSWSGGDKTGGPRKGNMAPMHDALTAGGIAWFSVNYRLAPQHRYPAGLEDVETAIRWVKTHAAEFRVDPKRLALSGDSSGGHYAALAAVRADESTRVAAIVPFFTPFDFVAGTKRRNAVSDTLQGLFGRTTLDEETFKILHDASPLYFVKPGLPPFLILQGTADTSVIPQQAIDMEARLREAGVPVERIMVEGGGHGMTPWPQFMPDYKERVVAWLNRTLAPTAAPSAAQR